MQEIQKIQVWSMGLEDPLEEGMANRVSILAWKIPLRGAWLAVVHGVAKSWPQLCTCTHTVATCHTWSVTSTGTWLLNVISSSVQFSSVAQSCLTLCDPMNGSMPGLPVHHQLPEFTQTHVHRVSDTIQPSHPLSSPSPPAPNPS